MPRSLVPFVPCRPDVGDGSVPTLGGCTSPLALPQRLNDPAPLLATSQMLRIRRCTFRRVTRVGNGSKAAYDVSCLYPSRLDALSLGELELGLEICDQCTARGVFRPDED
jgi:hypothetical protein